jgi:hypothetical protein
VMSESNSRKTRLRIHIHMNIFNDLVCRIRPHTGVPKRFIHKVNIPYYNVYTFFWDALYFKLTIKSYLVHRGVASRS